MENAAFFAAASRSIDCTKLVGVSHVCSPKGPAGIVGVPVLSTYFLQQMGLLQLASEPTCDLQVIVSSCIGTWQGYPQYTLGQCEHR